MIKRHAIVLAVFLFAFAISAQEIQHDAIAINIEVPVRVYKGKTFIDNLTIDDFEIYEDGILQKTEAMYLINKTNIEREDTEINKEEARKIFAPQVSRNFLFLFEIHEYLPKIGTAVEYFFNDVFLPQDSLTVVTPLQIYHFDNRAFERLSAKEISKQFIGQLRSDVMRSTAEYRGLLSDLEDIKRFEEDAIDAGVDMRDSVKMMHSNVVTKLRNLRYLDEKKLQEFAGALEKTEGPKHVFLFLQKLHIPIIRYNPVFDLADLEEFEAYMAVDETKIKHIFSSSSITAHMIFLTKISDLNIVDRSQEELTSLGVLDSEQKILPREIQDISGNFFSSFKDIAEATGGIVDSSTNAAASFKKTMDASENYYLLYYSPKNYTADGKFKEITVKVKGQNYRITHRAGYIAD
jgi:hypothetical protein